MEKRFRIWVYKEGEAPIFHNGPLNDIYSIEGQFIDEFESGLSPFLAKHPMEAISFFLPVSIVNIVLYVYRPYTNYSRLRLQSIFQDYVHLVSHRYPFWNQTRGADHFMLSCHDWAPDVSAANPKLFKHMIRVLCNANTSEGFHPTRDVSLPEIKIPYGGLGPPYMTKPPSNRTILAFFAGGAHGAVRETLLRYWKDKDKDIEVHGYLPKTANYSELMGESKYCLCPSGYEVASPRVVEAIYAACVPVIISDNYVLPFSEVLNWSEFSVHIPSSKIENIKEILEGITMEEYLQKQEKVIQVRRHFVVHRPAQSYDLMYMVLHSVWLRRLNMRLPVL
ncbi:probable glycosyltransferase At5g11130 [Neltuma alba]|uniref:probable glycosyltransferase At5g11130 n=1 Tax=Neltuma alba TaxID=207710 RepID=UPI0010A56138|nr:probable glycosyltransferase At5g11130 [Prosopis alba]